MKETKTSASILPSFHPTEPESATSIPAHFLVEGHLQLTKDGCWLFKHEEIEHKGVTLFLHKQMQRNQEGEYWVVNGPQRVFVELEDTPYLITQLHAHPEKAGLLAHLNDQSTEPLDVHSLAMANTEQVYSYVKYGKAGVVEGQHHRARFTREAIQQLAPYLVEMDDSPTGIGVKLEKTTPILAC